MQRCENCQLTPATTPVLWRVSPSQDGDCSDKKGDIKMSPFDTP